MSDKQENICLKLFGVFLKIGAFTLGGGYAMIPLVRDEVVERRHWMKDEEFLNMLALAQSAPGVMAVNTAIFTGYKLAGWRGVIAATLGSILPSFLIMLLVATVFIRFRNYPIIEAAFKGIRPAVVALIAAPLIRMARSAGLMRIPHNSSSQRPDTPPATAWQIAYSWLLLLIPIAVALLIWLLHLSPILIICLTIIAALAIVAFCDLQERRHQP